METIDLGGGATCEIYYNGSKWWYLNGKRHRTDGPAIEYASGYKAWFINGKEYSEEDFNIIKEVLWAI
jgi:hypothetical protein